MTNFEAFQSLQEQYQHGHHQQQQDGGDSVGGSKPVWGVLSAKREGETDA
jgi:hypothetical protein